MTITVVQKYGERIKTLAKNVARAANKSARASQRRRLRGAAADADRAACDEVRHMEDTWLHCIREQDAPCLKAILAENWVVRWADGSLQTKAEYLAGVAKHSDEYSSVSTQDSRIDIYGETAVATGVDTEVSRFSGQEASGRYAWLDIFAKRNGRWWAVRSQSTKLP